ncbi:DNRLRE domain-containing protein [Bacillus sp. 3255]|uniref:CBM96 family carbohydrate-binding protein n=1 Tax=Bacillus sp. 3255 TaxID=2817904 RepID=UPI00286AF859|nr:DNRLRE domain-containing protein [Bacillus sp. 3255]
MNLRYPKAIHFAFLSILLCLQLVLPALAAPQRAYAASTGVSSMSDADFFGLWDPAASQWLTPGKLNYAAFPALSAVQSRVQAGNYAQAEEELLTYFANRSTRTIQGYEDSSFNPNMLPILMDHIITPLKELYLTTFTVSNTPGTSSFDMLSKVNSALSADKMLSFMLMGRYKSAEPAMLYSREQNCTLTPIDSCQPLLTVQYTNNSGAQTATLLPTMDTFIRGNDSSIHAGEPLLQVLESGAPYDSNTRKAYLKFDLSAIAGTVTGATLQLSGYSEEEGGTDVMLYQTGDNAWDEAYLTYANHSGKTFSWQGNPDGTDWVGPATGIADQQYAMQITNFNWLNPLITAYALTRTESYAASYLAYMLDIIRDGDASSLTEGAGRFPLTFQASIRAANWVKAYHVLRSSSSLTASANTDLLKTFWKKGAHFATPEGYDPRNNHGAFELQAFYSIAVYFPEFTESASWLSIANSRFDSLISSLNFSDGSYSESSASYTVASANAFLVSKELGNLNGMSFNSTFDSYLLGMGKYLADMAYPNGILPLFGDGSSLDIKAIVKQIGDLYGDSGLQYVGTAGAQGAPPAYTSAYYPVSNTGIMRSGWSPNDRYLFINTKQQTSHRHPDDNGIVYYANGRPLLVDPGALSYSDEPVSNWLRFSTESHNTIEINDTAQTTAEGSLQDWADNGKFNYVQGVTRNVPGFTYVRDVLFLKSSYSIVSDYVRASGGSNKYQQTWHFLPSANPALAESSKKTNTRFNDAYGNMQVVPADPGQLTASLDHGYYSQAFYSVADATYTSYSKQVTGDVTFDTILYPTASGDNRDVQVNRLTVAPSVATTVASALKIDHIGAAGTSGYYYVSHEEIPRFVRSFDTFTFDGRLAYAEKSSNGTVQSALLKSGSTFAASGTNLITSNMMIDNIAVDWNGSTVEINGSNLVAASDPHAAGAIAIKAPGATAVKLNGTPLTNFTMSGDELYAVAVPAWLSSSSISEKDLGAGHTGVQTIEFDFIPTGRTNGAVIGYTGQSSAAGSDADLPISISLDANGTFKAWNGTGYARTYPLTYTAGESYHISILTDLASKTYSVFIAPKDGPEVQIADHYAYRTGAPAIQDIGKLVMKSTAGDPFHIYRHTVRDADYYTIAVAADAHVNMGKTTSNYGAAKTMEIRGSANPVSVRKAYLRFQLSDLPTDVSPEYSKMILTSATSGTSTDQLQVVSDDTWEESTLLPAGAPSGGAAFTSWSTPDAGQQAVVDVSGQVLSELAGDKQLSLLLSSPTNIGISHTYYTKENGNGSQAAKIRVYTKSRTGYVLGAEADSFVAGATPTTNYGSNASLLVKSPSTPRESYLRFDLSKVTGTVTSAKLRLTSAATGTFTDKLQLVSDDAWGEMTITDNNKPVMSDLLGSWTVPAANQYVDVDVTEQVISELAGDKKISLGITYMTSNVIHSYYAKESAGLGPQLIIYTEKQPLAALPYPATFSVNFESNGGSSVGSQTVDENGFAAEPAAPVRSGYTFGGWFNDEALTTPFSFGTTAIASSTTLFAKWPQLRLIR